MQSIGISSCYDRIRIITFNFINYIGPSLSL
jgi:hypothetical protein